MDVRYKKINDKFTDLFFFSFWMDTTIKRRPVEPVLTLIFFFFKFIFSIKKVKLKQILKTRAKRNGHLIIQNSIEGLRGI